MFARRVCGPSGNVSCGCVKKVSVWRDRASVCVAESSMAVCVRVHTCVWSKQKSCTHRERAKKSKGKRQAGVKEGHRNESVFGETKRAKEFENDASFLFLK